jgi:hypothetical protein
MKNWHHPSDEASRMEWLDMREAFLAVLLLGVMSSNCSP